MDDNWELHGADGRFIIVEWSMLVLPGRHLRVNVGLAQEVQGEFCLGE